MPHTAPTKFDVEVGVQVRGCLSYEANRAKIALQGWTLNPDGVLLPAQKQETLV